jgi:glycosyltransferase involved in cell wall biosynthesis
MVIPELKPVDACQTERPLMSIVVPTYQRPHLISATIQSLLDQTCDNFELLVRDDSRSDETENVVAAVRDKRIRYHRNQSRLGMPANVNAGIRDTRGYFVAVCHDHDLHEPTRLEKMLQLFEEYPDILFVHTALSKITEEGEDTGIQFVGDYARYTPGVEWLRFMLSSFSCPVAADIMVRRSSYECFGLYDLEYGFVSDVEMSMRLSLHGQVGYLSEPLSRNRAREAQHEHNQIRWDVIDALAQIHSNYIKLTYNGAACKWHLARLMLRLDRYVALSYLACAKRRDTAARITGREYIRRSRLVFSRVVSFLL